MYNLKIINDIMLLLIRIIFYSLHFIFYSNSYKNKDFDWNVNHDGSIHKLIGDNKQIYFMYHQSVYIVYVIST